MHQRITLCAIAKNEAEYIREWVDYHSRVGFDRIIIYDNGSVPAIRSIVDNNWSAKLEVREWPDVSGQAPQVNAYNDCLAHDGKDSSWIMFLDLDEFFNLKMSDSIQDFLRAYEAVDAVAVHWRIFGSSGKTYKEPGLVTERFQMASGPHFPPNAHVKTIFKPQSVSSAGVHSPRFLPKAKFVNTKNEILPLDPDGVHHNITLEIAQINHYFVKSAEEFERKRLRGRGDVASGAENKFRVESEFQSYDINRVLENSILRFWSLI